jgi:hypothetical protein
MAGRRAFDDGLDSPASSKVRWDILGNVEAVLGKSAQAFEARGRWSLTSMENGQGRDGGVGGGSPPARN